MITWPRTLARYSFWAPIVGFLFGLIFSGAARDRVGMLTVGVIGCLFFVTGLIAAVTALLAMYKHGREGVLGYGLAGLGLGLLWAAGTASLLLVTGPLLFKPYTDAQLREMPLVQGSWQPLVFGDRGFRLEVPPDFVEGDRRALDGTRTIAMYVRPDGTGAQDVIVVEAVGGLIESAVLTQEQRAELSQQIEKQTGLAPSFQELSWLGKDLTGFSLNYEQGSHVRQTCSVQIPLLGEAVQLTVNAAARQPDAAVRLTQQILDTLKGKRLPPRPSGAPTP